MIAIPKIIMQTWKNHDIPDKWKISPESIKKHMPDWTYVLQTDEDNRNLIRDHYPQYLRKYDAFRYNIQRVDFVRYAWLHKHGGIYMDLDYEVTESLDRFFKEGSLFFLPMHGDRWCYCNSFMASVPNHPFWLKLMDHINQTEGITYFNRSLRILCESGPGALRHVLRKESFAWTVLPREIRTGELTVLSAPTGALRPLEGGSWVEPQILVMAWPWVYGYRHELLVGFVIIVVVAILFIMSTCGKIIILYQS